MNLAILVMSDRLSPNAAMALAYLQLRDSEPKGTMSALFQRMRDTEAKRGIEIRMAIRIQRWIRGWVTRKYLKILNQRSLEMQRLWRGYRDRRRVAKMRKELHEERNRIYHDYMATKIQKIYRGWYSRKHFSDFYKRKTYIRSVLEKSTKMMKELDEKEAQNFYELKLQKEREMAEKFASLTANMHHLISTKTQPGVFNATGYKTTAFGVPIEAHIKSNFSETRQQQILNLQRSIRAKYSSRGPQRSRQRKANFYPFGSRSRRFDFSPPVSPLGPSPTGSPKKEQEAGKFTWAAAPSPVHVREVRRARLKEKEARRHAK